MDAAELHGTNNVWPQLRVKGSFAFAGMVSASSVEGESRGTRIREEAT